MLLQLTAVLTLTDPSLPVRDLDQLNDDGGASWVAEGGGAFQSIVETWAEFGHLKDDIASGKGRFVPDLSTELDNMRTTNNLYMLDTVVDIREKIFNDYIQKVGQVSWYYLSHFLITQETKRKALPVFYLD